MVSINKIGIGAIAITSLFLVIVVGVVSGAETPPPFSTAWGGGEGWKKGTDNGEFNNPNGIAIDTAGNVYVADSTNYRIQKFTGAGEWLWSFGDINTFGGSATMGPKGIDVDASDNIYVANRYASTVQVYEDPLGDGNLNLISSIPASVLSTPCDIAVDGSGDIYVTEQHNHRVRKFTPSQGVGFVEVQGDGVDGLAKAYSVTVSADGNHLYTAAFADAAVVVFSRDSSTGALTFVEVHKDTDDGVDGLMGATSVTVSPDGSHVYVAGMTDHAVAVFSRNADTGRLTFVESHKEGVDGVDGLMGAFSVTVSPDGNYVYATAYHSDALAMFSRNADTGRLTFAQVLKDSDDGVDGLNGARKVTVSPDESHIYVASSVDHAVAVFSRDATTDALTFVEVHKDIDAGVDGLNGAFAVTVSPEGSHAYVAGSVDNAVAVFSRNADTGRLTFVEVHKDTDEGVDGLGKARSVTVSPDGSYAFVASAVEGAVAVFSRDADTGRLTFVEAHKDGVDGVDGLNGATSVTVSSDGNNFYVVGQDDNAVAVFVLGIATWAHVWSTGPAPGQTGTDNGEFEYPCGLAVSPDGYIFVADMENHRVQKLDSDGVWAGLTIGKGGGFPGTGNGEFTEPVGLSVDSAGNIYVVEFGGGAQSRIQKLDSEGVYLTQWGGNTTAHEEGKFWKPYDLEVGPTGNVYVVEGGSSGETSASHRVQVFGTGSLLVPTPTPTPMSTPIPESGKIVLAGRAHTELGRFALAKYEADGTLDASFGSGGKVTTSFDCANGSPNGDSLASAVAALEDGKILAAGFAASCSGGMFEFALAKYEQNGTLDTTFGTQGKVMTNFGDGWDRAEALTVLENGQILVVGSSSNGTDDDFALARYDADGTLDTTFGTQGKTTTHFGYSHDWASSLTVLANGKILVGGSSSNGTDMDFALARYDADGTLDTTFGSGGKATIDFGSGSDQIAAHSVLESGKILAAGYATNSNDRDFALALWDADSGGPLEFVGVYKDGVDDIDGLNGAYSVIVSPDGKYLYAAGFYDRAVAVFGRDTKTGTLTLIEIQKDDVGDVDGLNGAQSLALSPDGTHLYATSFYDKAVAVFHRDADDGTLTFMEVHKDGVGSVDGLNGGNSVTVSPDGRNVYVAGSVDDAVAVFDRNVTTWSATAASFGFTVGIKSDGTLWAWGNNVYGQLGDGTTVAKDTSTQEATAATDWSSIAVGIGHTAALKSDDTLWAWGYNFSGQLGDGTTVDKDTPTQIGSTTWSAITAGTEYTVGIKSDGTLWAWGHNALGQLGDGTVVNKDIPTQIGSATNWSTVAAGGHHTVGIKSDGTLWAWGYNPRGQLGDGTNVSKNTPTQIGSATWSAITAGFEHTVGIKSDGTLWAWGGNRGGQLGDGTDISKDIPTQIGSATWSTVDGGFEQTMAIDKDGALWAWGSNSSGQLGDGTDVSKDTPTQIGSTTWTAIASGVEHTAAIKPDGTLWIWGDNEYGQLGLGASADKDTPTRSGSAPGTLTFLEVQRDGVGGVDGLSGAASVTVSPDGGQVYVAGHDEDAVAVFTRNTTTGALSLLEVQREGVGGVDGLDTIRQVIVSPDGNQLYAASGGSSGNEDTITVFNRDSGSGTLTFLEVQRNGVGGVDGLHGARSVVVSPDGSHLFASSWEGKAVAAFRRNASDGTLTFLEAHKDGVGGVDYLNGAVSVTVSPDGRHVYTAARDSDAVTVFAFGYGTLDSAFGTQGKTTTNFGYGSDYARALNVLESGLILAGGIVFNGTDYDFGLARYAPNGSLDTTFGSGGLATTDFNGIPGPMTQSGEQLIGEGSYAMSVLENGKIVAGGITFNGTDYDFGLARYADNGSLDTTFGTEGKTITDFGYGLDKAYALTVLTGTQLLTPTPVPPSPPVAYSQEVSTTAGVPVTITLTGSDADGDSLGWAIVEPVTGGTTQFVEGSQTTNTIDVVFTPNTGFTGVASFRFYATDASSASNTATVNINVTSAATPTPASASRPTTTPTPISNIWDAPSTSAWSLAALVTGMLVVMVVFLTKSRPLTNARKDLSR